MNMRLDSSEKEHAPTNIKCPYKYCISNLWGYCQGSASLIADRFEYETKEDGHLVHEALQCENYMMRA